MGHSIKKGLQEEDNKEFWWVEGHGEKSWRVDSCVGKLAAHLLRLENHPKGSDSVALILQLESGPGLDTQLS